MGAEQGEKCALCGSAMNVGAILCTGCGAERKVGPSGGIGCLFFCLMGFGIMTLLTFLQDSKTSFLFSVRASAFFFVPAFIIFLWGRKHKDDVRYTK